MTNTFLDSRYEERLWRLALGVEPLDVLTGLRSAASLRVLVENAPAPLHRWRNWRPGESLDDVLSGLDRHPSGRFGSAYGPGRAGGTLRLRIVEATARAGPPRRVVPRRFRVVLADEATVIAAEPTPLPHPLSSRVFPVVLFPGASAPLTRGATVLRGRVTGSPAAAGEARPPLRWTRVSATDPAGDVVGWAHGDDRGEFVLVIGPAADAVVLPDDPLHVELTVAASLPAATPDPLDPVRAAVDRMWDLPAEPLPATATPTADDRYTGRTRLPGQTPFGPFPFDLPLGRETTVQIPID